MAATSETPTTRHYLNALNLRDGRLPAPSRGVWHEDAGFLAKYAQSVDLKMQLDSADLAHSVPSVFQRPIQFYQALGNPENPLHDVLVSEWRGLMAVLGLASWLELNVQTSLFQVPVPDAKAVSSVGATGNGDLHFMTILRNQLPLRESAQLGIRASDWERWWVIRCGGVALGATSPWTLLYTAYPSARSPLPANLPWQRGGVLIDPIQHYDAKGGRQPVELSILYAWVTSMLEDREAGLWQMPPHLGEQENLIGRNLKQWHGDLKKYERPKFTIKRSSSLFSEPPLSNILRHPDTMELEESDLLLNGKTKDGKSVIVFSELLPPDTRIFGGVFAGRVDVSTLEPEGTFFRTRDGVRIDRPYIVAERLFFPAKMVKLDLSDQALARGRGDGSIPLTPKFFEYFEHEDLARLSMTHTPSAARATLSIPLRNGRTLDVYREYADREILKLNAAPPAFAVWPDDYDESWTEGFAAYAAPATKGDDLRVQPLFRDGAVTDESETARVEYDQKDVRIWSCRRPAIGFSLRIRREGSALVEPAGLVLRKTLHRPVPLDSHKQWTIGVDFGTSSTTVMMDRGNGAEEMPFGARTVFLSKERTDQATSISNSLYPAMSTQPPFRTLLYEAGATKFGTQTTPYTLRFTAAAAPDPMDQPVPDLKWGHHKGQGSGNPLMAYLQALVRYIVWEARVAGVKNLEFRWSYPLSLPRGPLGTMRSFWNNVKGTYVHVGTEPGSTDPQGGMNITLQREMSESEAACRAFTAAGADARAGMLTIAVDIGGGSTDIAFWSEGKMLDQFSFKLAGNDILDRRYLTDVALGDVFEICYGVRPTSAEAVEAIQKRPEIYLNGALTEAKRDGLVFRGRNPRHHPIPMGIFKGGADSVPWINFRSMIYLFFSGLSYYLGVHTRSIAVKQPQVDIYFGGRGSALLTWLSASPEDTLPSLRHAFQMGLGRGADEDTPVLFPRVDVAPEFKGLPVSDDFNYPSLKTEVARGLLAKVQIEGLRESPQCVVGETGWTREGRKVDWHTRLSAEEIQQMEPPHASSFDSTTIGEFKFATLVEDKKKYLESLNLDHANLKKLTLNGSKVQSMIRALAEGDDYVPQPIFAYELKALMQQYAQEVQKTARNSVS